MKKLTPAQLTTIRTAIYYNKGRIPSNVDFRIQRALAEKDYIAFEHEDPNNTETVLRLRVTESGYTAAYNATDPATQTRLAEAWADCQARRTTQT